MSSELQEKRLFVLGAARSGTSLTHALLNQHPEIDLLYEADLPALGLVLGHRQVRSDWAARLELWNQTVSRHRLLDEVRFRGSLGQLASRLYSARGQLSRARWVGEKSVACSAHVKRLYRFDPQAHFLIVWRPAGDTAASALRAAAHSSAFARIDPVSSTIRWMLHLAHGSSFLASMKARVFHLNYDVLLQATDDTLRALTKWLQLASPLELPEQGRFTGAYLHPGEHHRAVRSGRVARQRHPDCGSLLSGEALARCTRFDSYIAALVPESGLPVGMEAATVTERLQEVWREARCQLRARIIENTYRRLPLFFLERLVKGRKDPGALDRYPEVKRAVKLW